MSLGVNVSTFEGLVLCVGFGFELGIGHGRRDPNMFIQIS